MNKILRISILAILIIVALVYFNSSLFSAWVSGGPPTDYPQAYAFRAYRHFFYGIGFIVIAITFFLVSKPKASQMKLKLFIGLTIALAIFSTPHIKKFFQVDACLESGGRWNEQYHRCDK